MKPRLVGIRAAARAGRRQSQPLASPLVFLVFLRARWSKAWASARQAPSWAQKRARRVPGKAAVWKGSPAACWGPPLRTAPWVRWHKGGAEERAVSTVVGTASLALLGMSLFTGDKGGFSPCPPDSLQPAWGTLVSLQSLCHIFFATWCHLTRRVALPSLAEDLEAVQVLGERDAIPAASSSEVGRRPGTQSPPCLLVELNSHPVAGGGLWPLLCPVQRPVRREPCGPGCARAPRIAARRAGAGSPCLAAHRARDLRQVCPPEPQFQL